MVNQYLEKVYSGFLGMNIGIRLGAPVEPNIWSYDRIRETYGEITGYVKDYKNFAADDDANGPVFFLRALIDDAVDRPLEPQDVARAWLNYAREGVGMFWWGGYGVSTEHTAFINLKNGVNAPASGSIQQNGQIMAEQIGGQIFIDTWGLVNPCNPKRAADYGQAAASVSHDGNGVWGARFMCAAIARAFETSDIHDIIETGLSEIPAVCTYRDVCNAVIAFHEKHPENWRNCYKMLVNEWGYDRYPGMCHIIPNAGVCIMALLYGCGDFNRTVEIATMASWDTDCNAGNVGTILGVAKGIEGIGRHYLEPINDSIVCSGISGYLNILDIPSFCRETALLGYRIAGEEAPEALKKAYRPGEIYFDFELPGSTHNFRVSDPYKCRVRGSRKHAYAGEGSLEILMDHLAWDGNCKVFYKPFYTRDDFSDERYSPVFTPTAFPGQTVSMKLFLDQWDSHEFPGVRPYVRTVSDQKELLQGYVRLEQGKWVDVSFTIPDTCGDQIDEIGIVLESYNPPAAATFGCVYLDEFSITGKATYTVDLRKQKKEFGSITPFSVDRGVWELRDGLMHQMRSDVSFAYSGNYYAKDYTVSAPVTPLNGVSHMLVVRAQGAQRGYAAGLGKNGKAVIIKNDFGYQELASCDFPWALGQTYELTLTCVGHRITLSINGKEVLTAEDSTFSYGMFGCGSCSMGRTAYGNFTYKDL